MTGPALQTVRGISKTQGGGMLEGRKEISTIRTGAPAPHGRHSRQEQGGVGRVLAPQEIPFPFFGGSYARSASQILPAAASH